MHNPLSKKTRPVHPNDSRGMAFFWVKLGHGPREIDQPLPREIFPDLKVLAPFSCGVFCFGGALLCGRA